MGDVVLFPYLYLDRDHRRVKVGPWLLITKGELTVDDAVSPAAFQLAHQHLALYSRPSPDREEARRCGCFARPAMSRIGDVVAREDLPRLRLSVLAALLVMNPDEDEPNPGMRTATSDNAAGFGHPLNANGHVVLEYGTMMRTSIAGIRAPERPNYISHAPELHLPQTGNIEPPRVSRRLS